MSQLYKKSEQHEAPANSSQKTGRRRFVQGMGVLLPTILTTGTRSALACSCLSPSASASINLLHSRPDRPHDGSCAGRTPGYWVNAAKTHSQVWNLVGAKNTLFGSIYPGGFPGKTLKEVMAMNGTQDPYQLGAHLAAAWCNWKMGWVSSSVVNLSDLQAMWAGRTAGYVPVSGVTWYSEDIVEYLKSSMLL